MLLDGDGEGPCLLQATLLARPGCRPVQYLTVESGCGAKSLLESLEMVARSTGPGADPPVSEN
jgi:hypothetical protein